MTLIFLGNALLLVGPPEQFIQTLKTVSGKYGQVGRLHIGTRPNVYVGSCPEAYEKILSSNKQITKVYFNFKKKFVKIANHVFCKYLFI